MDFKLYLETSEELFKNAYSLGEMPREEVEKFLSNRGFDFSTRRAFTTYFGWSVPCKEAVEAIKKYARQPLYDVLAGTGYWTKILKKAGINVIASDIHKITSKNYYHRSREDLPDISNLIKPEKEKILRRNALRVAYDLKRERLKGDVLISWAPYEKPFATDILEMLPIGSRVFYIGEGMGGCTADASFHKYLCVNFEHLHTEYLPQFPGIHDYLSVYEKKQNLPIDPKHRGENWIYEDDD